MVNPRSQKNKNTLNAFLKDYFSIVIVVSLIAVLALSYFIFLQPKFIATQSAIRTNLETEQGLLLTSLKKLATYKSMEATFKKIDQANLRRFNTVLPDGYVPEKLYGEIEEMVARGGWLVGGITVGAPKAPEEGEEAKPAPSGKGEYDLEISVEAIDYAGLKNLLKIFENNLRLYDVANVSFSPDSQSAVLTLKTYYYQAGK